MKVFFLFFFIFFSFTFFSAQEDRYFQNSKVFTLFADEFDEDTKLGKGQETWFVMFYEKNDDESLELLPKWKILAEKVPERVKIGIVDCEEEPSLKERFGIERYPTLIYISRGKYYVYPETGDYSDLEDFTYRGYASKHGEEVPINSKILRIILKVLSFVGIGTMVLIFAMMFLICLCEYFGPQEDEDSGKEKKKLLAEVKKKKKTKIAPKTGGENAATKEN